MSKPSGERSAAVLVDMLMIIILTLHLATESFSAAHHKRQGKSNRYAVINQNGPRRSGILEMVQTMPTSTTPTNQVSVHLNSTVPSTKDKTRNSDTVNKTPPKTKLYSVVNSKAVSHSVSVVQNTTNGLKNLTTYSFDKPNSFPQPTSIPAIDTLSEAWPKPMGAISNEMEDVESPPSMQPIANEMSNEEKIPGIADISDMERIPLDFQEEEPWERSQATVSQVTHSHSTHDHDGSGVGHAVRRHVIPTPRRRKMKLAVRERSKITDTYVRGRGHNNPRTRLRIKNAILKARRLRRKGKFKSENQILPNPKVKKLNGNKTCPPCSFVKTRKSKKKMGIPPPAPIDPIQPLLEKFEKEKEVGDIKEHTVDIEKVKPNEGIDKHLKTLETQPEITSISEHLTKEQIQDIEPIENHQLELNTN
ncbi:uncharacterized protein LOC111334402 [Stylophora pistillata]|uniref:Uncharacterized protein n=1 Tax=Stylophora pistillata TaxID=50429 RepID=A0A2B4RXI8_STYPI|nr:uncharacterized protein LOC111334402 [Stylophora pistillata]PFX22331.1 hypothetical protein AWC38_SpisGene13155 [Stylophora pistillata]